MDLTFQTEKKENSIVELTVNVNHKEIEAEYKKLLNETQKNIKINGFRPGKVPLNLIETKYKKVLLSEASHKVMDKSFQEIYDKLEFKPISTSTPALKKIDELNELPTENFSYTVQYETFPEITFSEYKNVDIQKEEIIVSDDDVEYELNRYLSEFSTIEPKEGPAEEGDIVLVAYTVKEKGNEVDTKENEYVHIGKKFDNYHLSEELKGLKINDEKEFEKKIEDTTKAELNGKTLQFSVQVKEIKREKKPLLDDEMAKKIDKTIESAEAFKIKLKKDLETYAKEATRNRNIDKVMDGIIPTFKGDIPQSMIEAQIDSYYRELLERSGGNEKKMEQLLTLQGHTPETYRESLRDKAVIGLKRSLIINKIVELEQLSASKDEVIEYLEKYSKAYQMEASKLYELFETSKQIDNFESEVKIEKALDLLYTSAKSKKIVKLSLKELDD